MALRSILIILAIVFPAMVLAKDFMVGDDKGWTINFDYQAWAQGKDFRVGDRLVFQYPVGAHNVFKVNGTGFQNCIVPPLSEALTSGKDTIVLATPGRKWYLCGVGQHCAVGGQKLFINVQPEWMAPTAAPFPSLGPSQTSPYTSSVNGIAVNVFQSLMVAVGVAIFSVFRA